MIGNKINYMKSLYIFLFTITLLSFNAFGSNFISYIFLCLIYCYVYYSISIGSSSIIGFFILGLLVDSINNISFGLSSCLFLLTIFLIDMENKYLSQKDLLTMWVSFIFNACIYAIAISLFNFIFDYNVMIVLKIIGTSLILFPFMYYTLSVLYKYLNSNHDI